MDNKIRHMTASIVLKCICIAAVIYGCTTISEGWSTVTKFTTLSNIGIAVAVFIVLIDEIRVCKGKETHHTQGKYVFKFMMTISILITFLLFLAILAPTSDKGFVGAYMNNNCGSLAHHFIAPLAAIADFFIFDQRYEPKVSHVFVSLIVPVVYVLFIVILAVAGYRWPGGMYAPYNFLNFGAPVGWWGFDLSQMGSTSLGIGVGYLVFALMIIFALLGLGMIAIKKHLRKTIPNEINTHEH